MAWEDMTDVFGVGAPKQPEVGQVFTFMPPTGRLDYRIMRIRGGKVWGKKIVTVHPKDVIVTDKKSGKKQRLEDAHEF